MKDGSSSSSAGGKSADNSSLVVKPADTTTGAKRGGISKDRAFADPPTLDILTLAQEGLRGKLRLVLTEAARTDQRYRRTFCFHFIGRISEVMGLALLRQRTRGESS